MTLSERQGYAPNGGILNAIFCTYVQAAVDKVSTDTVSRGPSAIADLWLH